MQFAYKISWFSVSLGILVFALRFPSPLMSEPSGDAQTSEHRLVLNSCHPPNVDGEARCGRYEVYENRATQSGRKISLNIVVLPALGTNPTPDSVFWFHGGPGAAATEAVGAAKTGFLSVLRKDHDLVFVDQRGTGNSNGLKCDVGDDPANLDAYFGKLFPPEMVRACREKLEKQADLRLYTTPIAMDDLDEVREALGYGKINLVAASYGSVAAQVFMRRHPDSVRAVFLIGVATPAVKQPLLFPRAAQHALDLLFVDCAADQTCHSAFPNLKSEFDQVFSRFDSGPLEVKMITPTSKKVQLVRLERENYVERIRLLLYTATFARFVPLVVHKAYEGDFLPFEAISIAYNPGGILARGMYFTVTCSEGVPFITHREMITETRGTFVGEERIRAHMEACQEWPRGDVPRSFIDPIKSDLPVLMVSGEVDGSSPPWFGKDAVKYLPNGRQIPIRYAGHEASGACVWGIMRDFIQKASVQDLDTLCTAEIRRPPFATEIPVALAIK